VDRSHAEAILSSARREAQNNPTNAFSLFNEAVALVGWTDAVIAARTTIMATILNHHLPSRTQDIAKCLRVTDGFIKTMPEEPLLHLRRADFLIQAQRFEEARAALNRARELAYTEDEVQEANYYEAYLIHREKGSYATALRLLDTVPRDHPRYPDVLRIRLMLEIRTRRVEAGFATLEEARTLDAVSPSRLQEAEAELLFLRGDPRSLQKAHRLATEALRDASPTSARSITHLLERIANAQRNPGR
jgi:tetratricopeptide (TPR) repeat protein